MPDIRKLNQMAKDYEDAGNEEMAYRCYLESAMSETDGESLCELGNRYLYGQYVNEDYDKAGHYFEMAHDAGYDLPGYVYIVIGSCKEKHPETHDLAMEWYRLAAEKGCEYGYECMGEMYMNRGEYRKALELFLKPGQKNTISLYNLGRIYEEGLGVEADMEKAVEYYRRTITDCWIVKDYGDEYFEKARKKLEELGIEIEEQATAGTDEVTA